MNKNWKKLVCAVIAVLMLAGCHDRGGETTAPSGSVSPETTAPTVTLPEGEGVEDWDEPVETDPAQTTVPPETTQPTEAPNEDSPEPSVDPTDPTEPTPTTPQTQPPATSEPQQTNPPQTGGSDPEALTYEEYLAMTSAQQQAHYEQFPSLEAYIAWHNAALKEYEDNQTSIEVTGGIDIGDFITP